MEPEAFNKQNRISSKIWYLPNSPIRGKTSSILRPFVLSANNDILRHKSERMVGAASSKTAWPRMSSRQENSSVTVISTLWLCAILVTWTSVILAKNLGRLYFIVNHLSNPCRLIEIMYVPGGIIQEVVTKYEKEFVNDMLNVYVDFCEKPENLSRCNFAAAPRER